MEILKIAVFVGTPLSFLGLTVALIYLAHMRRLESDETRLKNLPRNQRAIQADQYLTRYGIDGKNLSPDDKLALIRDELNKRHAKSRVLVIAATIAFVVCFAIAAISYSYTSPREVADDPDAFRDATGTISQPSEGTSVNSNFDASGTAQNVGKSVYLWLAVEIDGRIWPKEGRVTIDENGKWKQSLFEDGHSNQFGLSLWAANPSANVQLRAWLDRGQQTGIYPELRPLPGMKRLARVNGLRIANQ